MGNTIDKFQPTGTSAQAVVNGTSTANQVLSAPLTQPGSVRVYNAGTSAVWLAFGGTGAAASSTGSMMLAGSISEIYGFNNVTHIAAISTGTTTLNLTPGGGS